ncbi:MAG: hypothetical protein QOJ93_1168 [Actinomycetota bacterium]|jgi:hypothetical protein|nr:hypothetical protein [Actinomycetota bacterium]
MLSPSRGRTVPRFVVAALALVLLAPACHKTHPKAAAVAPTAPPIPSWLVTVVPLPGSSDAGVMAVDIRDRLTPPEYTRLTIDGTDVTAYAHKSPGLLHYISGEGPVTLRPGVHTIRVDRDVVGVGGAPDRLEESYIYTFRAE